MKHAMTLWAVLLVTFVLSFATEAHSQQALRVRASAAYGRVMEARRVVESAAAMRGCRGGWVVDEMLERVRAADYQMSQYESAMNSGNADEGLTAVVELESDALRAELISRRDVCERVQRPQEPPPPTTPPMLPLSPSPALPSPASLDQQVVFSGPERLAWIRGDDRSCIRGSAVRPGPREGIIQVVLPEEVTTTPQDGLEILIDDIPAFQPQLPGVLAWDGDFFTEIFVHQRLVPGGSHRLSVRGWFDGRLQSTCSVNIEGTLPAPGRFFALLFDASYEGEPRVAAPLPYAASDARAVADALTEHVPRLFVQNSGAFNIEGPTRVRHASDVTNALAGLRLRSHPPSRNDVVFVYLAGHGMTYDCEGAPGEYLFFPDPEPGERSATPLDCSTGLRGSNLLRSLAAVGAGKVVLVVDTCHADYFTRPEKVAPFFPREEALPAGRAPVSMLVLAASRSNESAYELELANAGLLTGALVRAIDASLECPASGDAICSVHSIRWLDTAARLATQEAVDLNLPQHPQVLVLGEDFPLMR